MFTQIKTSRENKELVSLLTRKLGFGAENVIARMAFTYSLSQNKKLNLNEIKDFGGKEYTKAVLFGDYYDIYLGLLCVQYGIYKTDKDIAKYIKMHVDDGLGLLYNEVNSHSNIDGFDFLSEKIAIGLANIS